MGMNIWTREELTTLIASWKAAYAAAATGKSYAIGGRTLTRYDLAEIRAQISWLQGQLVALSGRVGPVAVRTRVVR